MCVCVCVCVCVCENVCMCVYVSTGNVKNTYLRMLYVHGCMSLGEAVGVVTTFWVGIRRNCCVDGKFYVFKSV